MASFDETGPLINGLLSQVQDIDPAETSEWLESLDGLIDDKGGPRARYLLLSLLKRARERNVSVPRSLNTPYVNTIGVDEEPYFPGDEALERRYRSWIRWNAAVMVTRAQRPEIGVGGHISSYASVATLYEVGLNHFFRGKDHPGGGDQVFFQGHASPGVYARAYLEGRLTEEHLDGFRQEKSRQGHALPSYPHPRLQPDFWEFPTVSMGLGPSGAIYQAWTNRYLHLRGIKDTSQQHVWAFLGDGEMDEPESRGMLQLAANQQLDNLTFVVNCNLQRLDGPVRGNGKIIQELEAQFRGAGWNVIKVVWGREWDALLQADKDRALVNLMNVTPDGDFQTYRAESGAFIRENFFGRDPRTKQLVEKMSDDDIWALKRGGHDYRKLYAAYAAAMEHTGQPTVILAHTIKGYGLGSGFAGRNSTHQMKKLKSDDLKALRDSLRIPVTDEQIDDNPYVPPYYHPGADAPEIQYMLERRRKLGGFVPERRTQHTALTLPGREDVRAAREGVRPPGGGDDHGAGPPVQGPRQGQGDRPPHRPDHPGRGADVRPGLDLPVGEDLQHPGPELHVRRPRADAVVQGVRGRADHAHRHQRGRVGVGVPGGRHVLRDARRAADPVLLLLLDVRVPAHRRPVLGRRGPDGPRLPHRRHRRPHHADRRGPAARRRALAPAGPDHAARRALRRRVRVRAAAHRRATGCSGCTATTAGTRTSSTTSRSTTSRCTSRPSPRASTSRASCAASTSWPGSRATGRAPRSSPPASRCRGRSRPASCWPTTGACAPRSGR